MPKWSNWSGRLTSKPDHYAQIYSEQQAAALAAYCNQNDRVLRPVGAGHSHQDLVGNDSVIVDLVGLAGVISADTNSAWVWGGSRIHTLGLALHQHGLALPNQGDISGHHSTRFFNTYAAFCSFTESGKCNEAFAHFARRQV